MGDELVDVGWFRRRDLDQMVRIPRTLFLPVRISRTRIAYNAELWEKARMRVISKTRLREFWVTPKCGDSEGPLRAWHTHVSHKSVSWHSWSDVKAEYGSASLVGNCVVFNIGGNKYRLVTRILYPSQKVFILRCMTHAEYDEDTWKAGCGCYDPPPTKPAKETKTVPIKRKKRGE